MWLTHTHSHERRSYRWNELAQKGNTDQQELAAANVHGFGSVSRRHTCKPIIAAVVGGAHGGGMEMLVNCDLVVASSDAKFSFPEVKRGVVAFLGGILISTLSSNVTRQTLVPLFFQGSLV